MGLTCLHVFGFSDPKAPDLAERLGLAFQLTNIIRDVGSDYAMGRIYLPQEDLDRFGIRAEELRGPVTPPLQELLAFEAERAWQMYQEGAPLVARVNADSRATLVGAGSHVQQFARAHRRARIRRVFLAHFALERGKNPISADGGPRGATGWLVEG